MTHGGRAGLMLVLLGAAGAVAWLAHREPSSVPAIVTDDAEPRTEMPPLRAADVAPPGGSRATAPPTPRTSTWLAYRVLDPAGRPIAGARIRVLMNGLHQVEPGGESDSNGVVQARMWHAELAAEEAPAATVALIHPAFRVRELPFPLDERSDRPPVEVVLDPGETLEGTLVAPTTELRGAQLVARRLDPGRPPRGFDEFGETATGLDRVRVRLLPDDHGQFVVPGLAPGDWIVALECGCSPLTIHPDVWDATHRVVRLPSEPITLDPRGRRVTFTVASRGIPVAGATVTIPGRRGRVVGRTSEQGTTSGSVVVPVSQVVAEVAAPGFAPTRVDLEPGTSDVERAVELTAAPGHDADATPTLPRAQVLLRRIVGARATPPHVPLRLLDPEGRATRILVGWINPDEAVLFDGPVPTATVLTVHVDAPMLDGTYTFEAGDATTGIARATWDGRPFAELPTLVLPTPAPPPGPADDGGRPK